MDKDLEFLKDVDDRYLDVIVNVMINYDGGKEKLKAIKEEYSKFGTSYKNYLNDIIDIYINYGNDAYASVTKGIKNSYRHILSDVCSGFKINYDVKKTLDDNEKGLLERAMIGIEDNLSVNEMIELICSIYGMPKKTFLGDWIERTKRNIFVIRCIAPNPLDSIWDNPIIPLIKDLYQKGKPEFQVTVPCTLLIALFRRSFKA